MHITFIDHSGFMVETDQRYLLFDYDKGNIPPIKGDKPLYVFASHAHGDHFNPFILSLAERHPNTKYILSHDIRLRSEVSSRRNIIFVKPNQEYEVDDIHVITYKSTDDGVAFLLEMDARRMYHAGDMNWWFWKGESKQWNNNKTALFKQEIEKMAGMEIHVAFLPLDPRQEEYYYLGFEYMLKKVNIKYAVPMHMWKKYEIIDQLEADGYVKGYDTEVIRIKKEGQVFEISL